MKRSETKIQELKNKLGMESIPAEEFIQYTSDVINCMPEPWRDAMKRAYLEGKGQRFDVCTGKPLRTDSRYHIMTEHARRCFITLVELAKTHPETLTWLIKAEEKLPW